MRMTTVYGGWPSCQVNVPSAHSGIESTGLISSARVVGLISGRIRSTMSEEVCREGNAMESLRRDEVGGIEVEVRMLSNNNRPVLGTVFSSVTC